jgi:hypothetical protein
MKADHEAETKVVIQVTAEAAERLAATAAAAELQAGASVGEAASTRQSDARRPPNGWSTPRRFDLR